MRTLTGVLSLLTAGFMGLLLVTAVTGCGMMTSKGHMEFAGDAHGLHAFSDMINGLANARYEKSGYWKQRNLETTEEGYNERQPGFFTKLFMPASAAPQAKEE